MLSGPLAHSGAPLQPHDLLSWAAWAPDPVILAGLALVAAVYQVGRRGPDRGGLFTAGLAVIAVALLTPLDGAADSLASAHMVQHVLLTTVAAPLLALSRPVPALLRGGPAAVRNANRRLGRLVTLDLRHRLRRVLPATAWATAAAALWFWHARVPYELAVHDGRLHAVQHLSFLWSGLALWAIVVGTGGSRRRSPGLGLLLLFTLGLQTTLLAALMTFSPVPWYDVYADTTVAWGLDPLDDQRLAGVLMWFPTGLIHLAAAVWLLTRWLGPIELGRGPAWLGTQARH